MRLYINKSPYARAALVAAHEKGLLGRLEIVDVDPWSDPAALLALTPLGKVPILVTDAEAVLGESTRICEHFDGLEPRSPLLPAAGAERWRRLHLVGLAQGLADAAIAVVLERKRPSGERSRGWIDRQLEKVGRTVQWAEAEGSLSADRFDLAAIGFACALSFLDHRLAEIAWRRAAPCLAAWHEDAVRRPSMRFADDPGAAATSAARRAG